MSIIPRASLSWHPDKFNRTLYTAVNEGLNSAAFTAQGIIRESFTKAGGFAASPKGKPPSVKSGFLRRSVQVTRSRNLQSSVWSATPYSLIHEFGGPIPRGGAGKKFLPVPLNNAARVLLLTSPGGLRSRNLFVFRSKKGNLILMSKENIKSRRFNTNTNAQAAFVLKRTVRMPSRPYMRPGVFGHKKQITEAALAKARTVMTAGIVGGRR